MQLIYFWFSSTYPRIGEYIEGNLSSAYDFMLERDSNENYFLIQNKTWHGFKSVFSASSKCIENISAIVGANGAGKTTILYTLLGIEEQAKFLNNAKRNGKYRDFTLVFDDGKKLFVYTSINKLKYIRNENCNRKLVIYDVYKQDKIPFDQHTIVYLSNSMYIPYIKSNIISEDGIHNLLLTVTKLDEIAKKYYENLFNLERKYPVEIFKKVDTIAAYVIMSRKKVQNFQQLIDVLYWHEIGFRQACSKHEIKSGTDIGVWIEPITHIVQDYMQEQKYLGSISQIIYFLVPIDEGNMSENVKNFLPNENWQIRTLYFNLVCEVIWNYININIIYRFKHQDDFKERANLAVMRLTDGGKCLNERLEIVPNKKNIEPKSPREAHVFWPEKNDTIDFMKLNHWILEKITENPRQKNKEKENYFKDAMNEINTYRDILYKLGDVPQNHELGSIEFGGWFGLTSMNSSVTFQRRKVDYYNDELDEYGEFLKFFSDSMKRKSSFIIRYINISMLKMSSGERAIQNLFSWLTVVPPLLSRCESNSNYKIRKNLLLLIDEVDLYMHPQWQKSFIKILQKHLELFYNDRKIQVIITTHSPICLSDFPRENCIYIDYNRYEDKRYLISRNEEVVSQSIGKDIYALLRDSFFLKGSPMGDFADGCIRKLLNDIYSFRKKLVLNKNDCDSKTYCEDFEDLCFRAKIVGNVPLKKKIDAMLKDIGEWVEYVSNKN